MYVLLVLPKKQIEKVLPNEIGRLNYFLDCTNVNAISTYKGEEERMNYISHIINSVAKGEVEYSTTGSIIFTNENKETGENCFIEIPLSMVGIFLTEIQRTFMFYIEQLKIKYSK